MLHIACRTKMSIIILDIFNTCSYHRYCSFVVSKCNCYQYSLILYVKLNMLLLAFFTSNVVLYNCILG